MFCASACADPKVVVCSDGRTCPENTTCNEQLGLCVTELQSQACEGVEDGLACDVTAADEVCFMGVCLPSLCGDGIVASNEVCDDANTVGGDGCSARCDSRETCGNGFADLELGEDCDDGNLIEHDSCSSTCTAETPKWFHRPAALPARIGAGIAYDSKHDRIIVIGGHAIRVLPDGAFGVELEDAWEWDGRWREASFQPPPPPDGTFAFQLAYDEKHDRTLMYKGTLGDYRFGAELWSFDGTTWTMIWKQNTTTAGVSDGPNVIEAAMAYDPVHDQLVVHGGLTYDATLPSTVETSSTWLWSEASKTWSKLDNTATGINATRTDAAMAFDPKRGKIVMYGGLTDNSTVRNDLWELDGTTWSAQSMTGGPSTGRFAASLAWNTTCQCLVLFGGGTSTSNVVTNQTFTRTGTTWANISATANPPPARAFAALVSDGHGRDVLVGGNKYTSLSTADVAAYYEDQWIFDGAAWHEERGFKFSSAATDTARHRTVFYGGDDIASPGEFDPNTYELSEVGLQLRTTGTPDASRGGVIAYDEARHETVLVGGIGTAGINTRTYVWDGTTWTDRAPLPAALQQMFPTVVYDAARKEVVAFGGCIDDVCNDETWTWNGTTWTQKTTPTKPGARLLGAGGYDRTNSRVIMFGGFQGPAGSAYDDTWAWDGSTWTLVSTTVTPSTHLPMIAWDPARRRLVLLAGSYIDAWEWTGTDWSSLGNLGLRPAPSGAYAFSSFDGAGVTYTGGQTNGVSGTWELRWTSDHSSDSCRLAEEGDGDALAGCADADCWEVCTPTCLPGDTCDPAADTCGDNTCDPAETCRSCPADCTSCNGICGDGRCETGESCPGDCS